MNGTNRTKLPAAALLSMLTLSGCVALAAGAVGAAAGYGYVKYTENGAYRDFKADEDETWRAVADALDELGYAPPVNFERAKLERKYEVDDLVIRVEPQPEDLTRVLVKVGTFETKEHERKAKDLLDRVADRLE